jgi:3'(2'), 5'-bisphosphate nucleotidase
MDFLPNVEDIIELAEKAGKAVYQIYMSEDFQVVIKEDNSPLTKADRLSNEIITAGLREVCPEIPIITEEEYKADYSLRKDWEYCWCIDPLDGTKEFINQNGEFTINIALLKNSRPFFGLIHVPCTKESYYAVSECGAFKCEEGVLMPLKYEASKDDVVRMVVSRSHITPMEYEYKNMIESQGYKVEFTQYGAALKQCMIAEGKADVYPKYGQCYEWDTAAGDILVRESGGKVLNIENCEELVYNKEDLRNPEFVMFAKNIWERVEAGVDCFLPCVGVEV